MLMLLVCFVWPCSPPCHMYHYVFYLFVSLPLLFVFYPTIEVCSTVVHLDAVLFILFSNTVTFS